MRHLVIAVMLAAAISPAHAHDIGSIPNAHGGYTTVTDVTTGCGGEEGRWRATNRKGTSVDGGCYFLDYQGNLRLVSYDGSTQVVGAMAFQNIEKKP